MSGDLLAVRLGMAARPFLPALFEGRHFAWLEALRSRFDLAIEIVDPGLHYLLEPASGSRAPDLRSGLGGWSDPIAREAAQVVLQAGKAQSFSSGPFWVRVCPLCNTTPPHAVIGVLCIADVVGRQEPGTPAPRTDDIDRKLDKVGRWLAPAVERSIDASGQESALQRTRAAGLLDLIEALSQSHHEAEMLAHVLDALGTWYPGDVRIYRRDPSGALVLQASLLDAAHQEIAKDLTARLIVGRDEVFRLEAESAEDLGWGPEAAQAFFVPITLDDSVQWLLTVSGVDDGSAEPMLRGVRRILSLWLSALERESDEQLRRELSLALACGDAPFEDVARIALGIVARTLDAASAQLALYRGHDRTPMLAVGWGRGPVRLARSIDPGASMASRDSIVVGAVASADVIVALELHRTEAGWPPHAEQLARSAVAGLGNWMSGLLGRRPAVRCVSEEGASTDLVARLGDAVDPLGRLTIGGALIVVLPGPSAPREPASALHEVLHGEVRASDVVGTVQSEGAGVLLPSATREVAFALVARLRHAAQVRGIWTAKVGVTTFGPGSAPPELLVRQAVSDARAQA